MAFFQILKKVHWSDTDAAGISGPVAELGFFFKDPWGSDVHGFAEQTAELVAWSARTGAAVVQRSLVAGGAIRHG